MLLERQGFTHALILLCSGGRKWTDNRLLVSCSGHRLRSRRGPSTVRPSAPGTTHPATPAQVRADTACALPRKTPHRLSSGYNGTPDTQLPRARISTGISVPAATVGRTGAPRPRGQVTAGTTHAKAWLLEGRSYRAREPVRTGSRTRTQRYFLSSRPIIEPVCYYWSRLLTILKKYRCNTFLVLVLWRNPSDTEAL